MMHPFAGAEQTQMARLFLGAGRDSIPVIGDRKHKFIAFANK